MDHLSSLLKTIAKAAVGRPIGRYWHLWSQSCGFFGSSEDYFLCASMTEKISDDNWHPGPSALGQILGSCSISRDTHGKVTGWAFRCSNLIERSDALDMLFIEHSQAEIIKDCPELEGYPNTGFNRNY